MRFTMPVLAAAVAGAVLMFQTPRPLRADSKELDGLKALQRDLYELKNAVDKSNSSQDDKVGELKTLMGQLMEANTKLSADMRTLQDKLIASQADQQLKVAGPITDVKRAVDDLAGLVGGLQTSQSTAGKKLETTSVAVDDLKKAMQDIYRQLDTLKPPAPITVGPTPEQSAQLAFAAAQADRLTGKASFALQEFLDLARTYPASPYAPMSYFEIGSMYAGNEQYDQAIGAFDMVLERSGDSPMRGPAQFRKAEALEKSGQKEAAAREYEIYANENPGDMAVTAKAKAKELRTPVAPPPASKGKKSTKKSSK